MASKKEIRKALEEKAKVLGIKYVAVSTENLKIAVAEAEAKGQDAPVNESSEVDPGVEELKVEGPKVEEEAPVVDEPVVQDAPVKPEVKVTDEPVKGTNVAVIKFKGNEVRKYTLESHGKGFLKLAKEFVSDRVGYEVEYLVYEKGIKCPSCGHEFHL